jgi:polar amino acid transport system substrate-binding protein
MNQNKDRLVIRNCFICAIVLLSVVSFRLSGAVLVDNKNTIVIANGEWLPFLSKDLKHYGVFCHIITEAFASEGVNVIYKWVPWKRAYINTQHGEYDATAAWVPNPERIKTFDYSDTILVNKKVFFHLKSYPFNWNCLNDLKEIKIGGTLGYTYGVEFDEAVKEGKLKVDWAPTDLLNFKKLLKGRFDILPQELDVGYGYINQFFPEEAALFTHHRKTLLETTHHLIFSKNVENNKRLLKLFNKGLERLKTRGTLDEYLEASKRGEYNQ